MKPAFLLCESYSVDFGVSENIIIRHTNHSNWTIPTIDLWPRVHWPFPFLGHISLTEGQRYDKLYLFRVYTTKRVSWYAFWNFDPILTSSKNCWNFSEGYPSQIFLVAFRQPKTTFKPLSPWKCHGILRLFLYYQARFERAPRRAAYSEHSIAIHSISMACYVIAVRAIVCFELPPREASNSCDVWKLTSRDFIAFIFDWSKLCFLCAY